MVRQAHHERTVAHEKSIDQPLVQLVEGRAANCSPTSLRERTGLKSASRRSQIRSLNFRFGGCIIVAVFGLCFAACDALAGPLDAPGAQKALVCSACHGFGGNPPLGTMPRLAGMNVNYFKKAIKDYAEGKRPSPEMEPYSKYVMQFGVDEVAEYFAAQKMPPIAGIKADPKSISRGATLAAQCVSCHGPKGEAERTIPAVRGQNPGYLQGQMSLFAGDKRKLDDTGLDENKKRVFKGLSESDLADLAVYYATLK